MTWWTFFHIFICCLHFFIWEACIHLSFSFLDWVFKFGRTDFFEFLNVLESTHKGPSAVRKAQPCTVGAVATQAQRPLVCRKSAPQPFPHHHSIFPEYWPSSSFSWGGGGKKGKRNRIGKRVVVLYFQNKELAPNSLPQIRLSLLTHVRVQRRANCFSRPHYPATRADPSEKESMGQVGFYCHTTRSVSDSLLSWDRLSLAEKEAAHQQDTARSEAHSVMGVTLMWCGNTSGGQEGNSGWPGRIWGFFLAVLELPALFGASPSAALGVHLVIMSISCLGFLVHHLVISAAETQGKSAVQIMANSPDRFSRCFLLKRNASPLSKQGPWESTLRLIWTSPMSATQARVWSLCQLWWSSPACCWEPVHTHSPSFLRPKPKQQQKQHKTPFLNHNSSSGCNSWEYTSPFCEWLP